MKIKSAAVDTVYVSMEDAFDSVAYVVEFLYDGDVNEIRCGDFKVAGCQLEAMNLAVEAAKKLFRTRGAK
jgi:hypothetical protein